MPEPERLYIPLSLIEKDYPEMGAFAVAHAMSIGQVVREGQWIGFAVQLKEIDADAPTLARIAAALDQATLLSGKFWIEMTATKEHLRAARSLILADPRFTMDKDNSMLDYSKAKKV